MHSRLRLLAAAIVLLGLALVVGRWTDGASDAEPAGEAARAREQAKAVVYPRDTDARRRAAAHAREGRALRAPRQDSVTDPIHRALGLPEGGAIFVEVNAIRHSELAERLLRCRGEDGADELSRLRAELGIDPLEDLDRVALHADLVALSGSFGGLKLPPDAAVGEPYGEGAILHAWASADAQGGTTHLARVGEHLIVVADRAAQVKAAVDRVEGRSEAVRPVPAHVTGSEIYATVGPGLAGALPGVKQSPLLGKLQELVTGGTARVLVDEHVSLSLDLEAKSEADADDLARALGGALAAFRQQARSGGEAEVAALLERARVLRQGGGRFGVDVAVPGKLILTAMGCPPKEEALERGAAP